MTTPRTASTTDARKRLAENAAEANICEPHYFVWTWPIEGGSGSVGVCQLCGSVTTADRDAACVAAALRGAADDPTMRLSGHSGVSIRRLRSLADSVIAQARP